MFDKDLQRVGAAIIFFEAFSDKLIAFNYKHEIAVIFFETNIDLKSKFTSQYMHFKEIINEAKPKGSTKLYDALNMAVDIIKE